MTQPSKPYANIPSTVVGEIEPFTIHIQEQSLKEFKELLRLSPVAKESYENLEAQKEKHFGVTREWLLNAKSTWLYEFNWRNEEAYMNSFPQFKAQIKDDDGREYSIHFTALFSQRKDAVPVARFHGWPTSFMEFSPVLDLLKQKYEPEDLPYHVIVPSLPGWAFSTQPPLDKDWKYADSARIMHKLMLTLGFGSGYAVQGGDIGAAIARIIAATYSECKALHLNYSQMLTPDDANSIRVTDVEKEGLERYNAFNKTGNAYGRLHGTRPSTTSLILSSSPLALLSWIGEKYLEWTDPTLPIPLITILREVTLYWFTECAGTSIYPYREDYLWGIYQKGYLHAQKSLFVDKPMGYSYFPQEMAAMPKGWVERTGRLVWCNVHGSGGHFPALERPEALLGDIEGFLGEVWN